MLGFCGGGWGLVGGGVQSIFVYNPTAFLWLCSVVVGLVTIYHFKIKHNF